MIITIIMCGSPIATRTLFLMVDAAGGRRWRRGMAVVVRVVSPLQPPLIHTVPLIGVRDGGMHTPPLPGPCYCCLCSSSWRCFALAVMRVGRMMTMLMPVIDCMPRRPARGKRRRGRCALTTVVTVLLLMALSPVVARGVHVLLLGEATRMPMERGRHSRHPVLLLQPPLTVVIAIATIVLEFVTGTSAHTTAAIVSLVPSPTAAATLLLPPPSLEQAWAEVRRRRWRGRSPPHIPGRGRGAAAVPSPPCVPPIVLIFFRKVPSRFVMMVLHAPPRLLLFQHISRVSEPVRPRISPIRRGRVVTIVVMRRVVCGVVVVG